MTFLAWYNTNMLKSRSQSRSEEPRWHSGANVPMSVIRRFARQVAKRFNPEKIILFGSYAYGLPNEDSDVDLLVIVPCRNEHDQAFKIRCAFDAPFSMDLIVRKPRDIQRRLEDRDVFHTYIMTNGKVLYEKTNGPLGAKGGSRPRRRQKPRAREPIIVCSLKPKAWQPLAGYKRSAIPGLRGVQ